ncbi:hypothetical protein VdG1_07879 [Verticillium dahliae VDG1]|nr:hypothetical protein VdG1_07879 [Verticillium dahliae VDG1]
MEAPSNARPIAILAGYMVLAATLTLLGFTVFSLLAVLSLATTWYHMFRFFEWSYAAWKARRLLRPGNSAKLYVGLWLRETSLFKQAWASTFETPARAWWSLQIFGFCANWSVMLAVQAKKRKIPHMWPFMLLGQVVAISFASNLFFLAVLAHDVVAPAALPEEAVKPKERLSDSDDSNDDDDDNDSSESAKKAQPQQVLTPAMAPFWYQIVLGLTVGCAVSVPDKFGTPTFLPIVLAPHLLAFTPLLINRILRREAEGGGWELILSTLHEHPAVSSVGWDVICCWTQPHLNHPKLASGQTLPAFTFIMALSALANMESGRSLVTRDFLTGFLGGIIFAVLLALVLGVTALRMTDHYGLGHWKLNLRTPLSSMWMNVGYWCVPRTHAMSFLAVDILPGATMTTTRSSTLTRQPSPS